MEDLMHKRVRAAATAGWWALLVAVIMIVLQAIGANALAGMHPSWAPLLWGGASIERIQRIVLNMMAVFRVLVVVMFIIVVWLSTWSCKLKRMS